MSIGRNNKLKNKIKTKKTSKTHKGKSVTILTDFSFTIAIQSSSNVHSASIIWGYIGVCWIWIQKKEENVTFF